MCIFLGREAIEGKIYEQLKGFLGADSAKQLQDIIKNASISGNSKMAAIIGAITLLIGATAIFSEIQDSINSIWGIRPKPKKGWIKFLQNRFLSFSLLSQCCLQQHDVQYQAAFNFDDQELLKSLLIGVVNCYITILIPILSIKKGGRDRNPAPFNSISYEKP